MTSLALEPMGALSKMLSSEFIGEAQCNIACVRVSSGMNQLCEINVEMH